MGPLAGDVNLYYIQLDNEINSTSLVKRKNCLLFFYGCFILVKSCHLKLIAGTVRSRTQLDLTLQNISGKLSLSPKHILGFFRGVRNDQFNPPGGKNIPPYNFISFGGFLLSRYLHLEIRAQSQADKMSLCLYVQYIHITYILVAWLFPMRVTSICTIKLVWLLLNSNGYNTTWIWHLIFIFLLDEPNY